MGSASTVGHGDGLGGVAWRAGADRKRAPVCGPHARTLRRELLALDAARRLGMTSAIRSGRR
eukprot:835276-Pyramimonas_sp.AAC.1